MEANWFAITTPKTKLYEKRELMKFGSSVV